ncbi:MAG: CUB domain-containing protein [Bacteroidota bacterium]
MTTTVGGSTTSTGCSFNFYDGGGPSGNYAGGAGNIGTFTQVFCPNGTNDLVYLNFTSINLSQGGNSANHDDIQIYIGTNTSGTLIYDAPANLFTSNLDFYSTAGQCLTIVFTQAGTNNGPAPGWSASVSCLDATTTYTSGGSVSGCSGIFTDIGGPGGNPSAAAASAGGPGFYSNNQTTTYVFCPSTPGTYASLNFREFNIQSVSDQMIILDGNYGNAPIINSYSGTALTGQTITSSSADGCLTVIFRSNNSFTAPGWLAVLSCSVSPGTNSFICNSANCSGGCGYTICSNGAFSVNTGAGVSVEELDATTEQGCLGANGEVNSTWYYFSPQASGTLGFTLVPPAGLDFDYAIYGPYSAVSCPLFSNQAPLRCSFASANGSVGLVNGAGDFSEGAGGNNFTEDLDVTAGDVYVMLINSYSPGAPSASPTITWNGTAANSLNCAVPLPVELVEFKGFNYFDSNILHWSTASENNSDYFAILKSQNGLNWERMANVDAAGFSQSQINYKISDDKPYNGVTYYKLVQYDIDGATREYNTIALVNELLSENSISTGCFPNPFNESFFFNYVGKDFQVPLTLTVFDEFGRECKKLTIEDFNNSQSIEVFLPELSKGSYIFQVEQGASADRHTLMKL